MAIFHGDEMVIFLQLCSVNGFWTFFTVDAILPAQPSGVTVFGIVELRFEP